jgi:hypothetical protein
MHVVIGLVIALISSTAFAQPGLAPEQAPLRKAGLFHQGISVELLDVGAVQAITPHGRASGGDVGIAFQWDLGPRWALRLPIELGVGGLTNGKGYGELLMIPGVVYRWRSDEAQRWVPYAGGGVRLGSVGIGNTLVGKPLVVACCHDWDWGDSDGHGDPNTESALTVGSELWAGLEWNRTSWFSLQLAGALGYERVAATRVIVLRETLGLRFSL